MVAKSVLGVGKQNSSLVNPVERPFIAMNPILATTHCNKVILVVYEYGSIILSVATAAVRIKDAVGFHCANVGDVFSIALSHSALQVYQLFI